MRRRTCCSSAADDTGGTTHATGKRARTAQWRGGATSNTRIRTPSNRAAEFVTRAGCGMTLRGTGADRSWLVQVPAGRVRMARWLRSAEAPTVPRWTSASHTSHTSRPCLARLASSSGQSKSRQVLPRSGDGQPSGDAIPGEWDDQRRQLATVSARAAFCRRHRTTIDWSHRLTSVPTMKGGGAGGET